MTAFLCAASFFAGAQTDKVDVFVNDKGEGVYEVVADNAYIIPVWVSVQMPTLDGLRASESLPAGKLVPARSRGTVILTLETIPGERRRSYRMTASYAKGDPAAAKPDRNFVYLFPFAHGTKHRVTQGYNGIFTHTGPENNYALDFDLEMGTAVYAARDGFVFDVKKDSNRGGPSASFNKDANHISILHADGTVGNYIHLRQNGALVAPGDTVTAGQHIGYSGNTGFSSGPHLHFDVQVPSFDGKMHSIPMRFLNYDGSPVEAEEGGFYYASHPGGPAFPVVFGSALQNEDFAGYSARAAATGKVDLRFELIDETYKVFVQNGMDTAREITVELSLRNLRPSRANPLTVTVPALTEHFLLLLRVVPRSTRWEYGYAIRTRDAR